jgi:HD-GYP domain-containing protein (c-di-GMP phosphodiesterase class II)
MAGSKQETLMAEIDFQKGLVHVISLLTAAVTNTRFYSETHPQVGKYVESAYKGLTHLLGHRQEITVFLVGDDVVADNKHLPSDSPNVVKFVQTLKGKAIERITFVSGLPQSELQVLIRDLASTDSLSVSSSRHIKLGKVEVSVDAETETPEEEKDELEKLLEVTGMKLDEVKELYLKMKQREEHDARSVDDVVKEFIKGFRRDLDLMHALAALKSFQEHAFTHAVNVGMLTMAQGETMGFSGEQLHDIGVAGMLHDVGKLFLPKGVVDKFGEDLHRLDVALMLRDVGKLFLTDEMVHQVRKLTKGERFAIEGHTVKGALHVMGLHGIPKMAAIGALEHHVKYDGTGYPAIKTGWKPNLVSQMITVSDVFDAMPAKDQGEKSKPLDKIAWVLKRGKEKSFNPDVVDHFLALIEK